MKSGELLVLDSWMQSSSEIRGSGVRYNRARVAVESSRFSTPLDSIALLEYRVQSGSRPSGIVGMAVWTVLAGAATVSCVIDPKACFGSCPTFYLDDETGPSLVAEGFSGSIARVLERRDLDALHDVRSDEAEFSLTMRNEALETHAVRGLTLLAAPAPSVGRVMATPDDRFFEVSGVRPPSTCTSPEGDCLAALSGPDGMERLSGADSTDLATRETIELTFDSGIGEQAILLAVRQSLMSTYLFYESLGFLGTRSGDTVAMLERLGPEAAERALGMGRLIGQIDFQVWDGQTWQAVGTYSEDGPLAVQYAVIPTGVVPETAGPISVRAIAPKGAWRIDWIGLADLGPEVRAFEIAPRSVMREGIEDEDALSALVDSTRHLVTFAGDTYRIAWSLPSSGGPWDLFLRSEGYYYEWMREEWLDDEDAAMAAMVYYTPAEALRVLAPSYKAAEPLMEERFWSSRFSNR